MDEIMTAPTPSLTADAIADMRETLDHAERYEGAQGISWAGVTLNFADVRQALADLEAAREAPAAKNAHFAKMQDMARRYRGPGAYVDKRGRSILGSWAYRDAFISDILHMLDGPEQRKAFPGEGA